MPYLTSMTSIETNHYDADHTGTVSQVISHDSQYQKPFLRLRGIMIGHHFHANMKLQTAMCKDNNNSKSRAATYVKFDIYIK